MKTAISPSLEEFIELAKQGNVAPVFADFIADAETPIQAFHKLCRGGPSFLFESTEKNDVSGRFSFVGTNPRAVIRSDGRDVRISERGQEEHLPNAGDPLDEMRKFLARYQVEPRPELSPFCGGAVGFVGYDAISSFERKVPVLPRDPLELPELVFLITGHLLVFDPRL